MKLTFLSKMLKQGWNSDVIIRVVLSNFRNLLHPQKMLHNWFHRLGSARQEKVLDKAADLVKNIWIVYEVLLLRVCSWSQWGGTGIHRLCLKDSFIVSDATVFGYCCRERLCGCCTVLSLHAGLMLVWRFCVVQTLEKSLLIQTEPSGSYGNTDKAFLSKRASPVI